MPRLVDHEVRRREITDAVRRVLVRGGLEAVTFHSVAAEAGISVRLVQYYFGTKHEFLLATHRAVMQDAGERFADRWHSLGADIAPRGALRSVLVELLPLDERRREEAVVLGIFGWATVTGGGITADETFAAPRLLQTIVADRLRLIASTGPRDIDRDAHLITLTVAGLAQAMLQGYDTPASALALVDHLLDRVAGPGAAADHRTTDSDSEPSAAAGG